MVDNHGTSDFRVNPRNFFFFATSGCLTRYVMKVSWCYNKPFDVESFVKYLQPSLDKGHLTNDGPLQPVLQAKIKRLLKCESEVLLCASGTAALHSLVSAFALKEEKILTWATQAFTFPSSIQGPLRNALVVDNDPTHYGPCMKQLEEKKGDIDG
jgi:dTDP-4-amino-4,6-dideoxygalactose transaminase